MSEHRILERIREEMELGETIDLVDGRYINNGKDLQPLRGRDIGNSLQTYSGRFMWPLEPYVDEIDAPSVAHGISCEYRYGNQSPYPYPVAWHCVALSYVVPVGLQKVALIHDAPEAYLKDIPRTIRRQEPFKSIYDAIEDRLMRVCMDYFEVDYDLLEELHYYDVKMSWSEMHVWARDAKVFRAKMNAVDDIHIEDADDEAYIKWVEGCPRRHAWQKSQVAWLERYHELF